MSTIYLACAGNSSAIGIYDQDNNLYTQRGAGGWTIEQNGGIWNLIYNNTIYYSLLNVYPPNAPVSTSGWIIDGAGIDPVPQTYLFDNAICATLIVSNADDDPGANGTYTSLFSDPPQYIKVNNENETYALQIISYDEDETHQYAIWGMNRYYLESFSRQYTKAAYLYEVPVGNWTNNDIGGQPAVVNFGTSCFVCTSGNGGNNPQSSGNFYISNRNNINYLRKNNNTFYIRKT